MTPETQVLQAAFQRAGVAVTALRLGIPISGRGVSLADMRALPPGRKKDRISAEHAAAAQLAGWAAARRHRPGSALDEWSAWEETRTAASVILNPFASSTGELDAYVMQLQGNALKLVKDPRTWAEIRAVAAALVSQLRLSEAELIAICENARNAMEGEWWRKNRGAALEDL